MQGNTHEPRIGLESMLLLWSAAMLAETKVAFRGPHPGEVLNGLVQVAHLALRKAQVIVTLRVAVAQWIKCKHERRRMAAVLLVPSGR